jgi:hypothetical protein
MTPSSGEATPTKALVMKSMSMLMRWRMVGAGWQVEIWC